jgi:hypothetical protein
MNVFDDDMLRQCMPISLSKTKINHSDFSQQQYLTLLKIDSKARNFTERSDKEVTKKKSSASLNRN